MPAALEVERVRLAYDIPGGARVVASDLSLRLAPGEIGSVLGASGCGKSTLLRAIAGLEPLRAGSIALGGIVLSSASVHMAPERRKVGMMFQDYALFPHLTAAENIGFGLRRWERGRRAARIEEMLSTVGLGDLGGSYPHELSGGQQQRVALARSLAPAPELLLLDEPLSNLDAELRERLAAELRRVLTSSGTTALMVTHHRADAEAVADRIDLMAEGKMFNPPASRPSSSTG